MTSTANAAFPKLPALLRPLIRDEAFWQYGSAAGGGAARLRVWTDADGGVLAVVTETGQGTSITNAIEYIWVALTTRYGPNLTLIEHWPSEHNGGHAEHLDQVTLTDGRPAWRRIWPVPPTNPDHRTHHAWMTAHGSDIVHDR